MKVIITGAAGQLGQALRRCVPAAIAGEPVELIATSRSGGEGALPLDLADAAACRALVEQHKPDWLINAGAYTAVDKAESEPELARINHVAGKLGVLHLFEDICDIVATGYVPGRRATTQ